MKYVRVYTNIKGKQQNIAVAVPNGGILQVNLISSIVSVSPTSSTYTPTIIRVGK